MGKGYLRNQYGVTSAGRNLYLIGQQWATQVQNSHGLLQRLPRGTHPAAVNARKTHCIRNDPQNRRRASGTTAKTPMIIVRIIAIAALVLSIIALIGLVKFGG